MLPSDTYKGVAFYVCFQMRRRVRVGGDKYVVAQFRADASLGWVPELRSFLNLPELKYRDFQLRRHQVQSNAMWTKIGGPNTQEVAIANLHRLFQSLNVEM